jgi:hypothetical protein
MLELQFYYYHRHYLFYAGYLYIVYIPETNNVPKEYNVAAILSLLFMVPIPLVPVLTV